MKFTRHIELEHGLRQIDIAPLINVIFLLLIFFMLTSSFVIQPGIRVSLPKAVTSEAIQLDNVSIVISSENIISVDGKAVTKQELASLLNQAAKRNQSVIIKADKRASLGNAVEVWDICRNSGIRQINIATDQK